MRILVTGATGFIGRHLVSALVAQGDEVVSASRAAQGPPGVVCHVTHDFAAGQPFPDLGRLDAVVHLAGASNPEQARVDMEVLTRMFLLSSRTESDRE